MWAPMAKTTVFMILIFCCLVLLCQVQGEGSHKDLSFPLISCPQGSHAWHYNCYALDITPKSWQDAEMACQKWPVGHLVSVLSEAEASFVSSLVMSIVDNNQPVWIGLHDPTLGQGSNGGHWKWSNDDQLKYISWEGNQSTALNNGYCVSLAENSGFLQWKEYPCDTLLPFVCKLKY